MSIPMDWWKYFLTQNPQWDRTTLTYGAYEQFWDRSVEEFGVVIGSDNPNLSAFRNRGGGPGPAPNGQFDALRKWVEEGQAPDTLNAVRRDQAGNIVRTRPLCQFPLVARYKGRGSTDDAANFVCSANFLRGCAPLWSLYIWGLRVAHALACRCGLQPTPGVNTFITQRQPGPDSWVAEADLGVFVAVLPSPCVGRPALGAEGL